MKKSPSALYVHVPFCLHICHYCDFCKLLYDPKFIHPYLEALRVELQQYPIGKCNTIYIGGGTPTSLNTQELNILLTMLDPYVGEKCEYTIEVNPETIDEEKIQLLASHHINRMSIGIQTFDEAMLRKLNRFHRLSDVKKTVELAHQYGITNLSFDFIYGLEGTTFATLQKDLDTAFSFHPTHLSLYALMIEPNTVFYLQSVKALEDDVLREMYDYIKEYLEERDFYHYEVSNFAKDPSFISKHNMTYWRGEHYFGIGLGASGYIDDIRYSNTRSLQKYLKHEFIDKQETLKDYDREFEYLMLKFRTIEGISFHEYEQLFHKDFLLTYQEEIQDLQNKKLLIIDQNRIYVSEEGIYILDSIIAKFIQKLS